MNFWEHVKLWGSLATVIGACFVAFNGCEVDDDTARDTVEKHGMRDVKLGGAQAFACSEDERSRAFTAINVNGREVGGVVCCGFTGCSKACTVRW